MHNAVVLHEDKQYYPSAQDVYGVDVETLVQEEDAQPLSEPIIAPVKVRKWVVEEKDMPVTRFDKGFVLILLHHRLSEMLHVQFPSQYDVLPRNDSKCCCCWTSSPRKNGPHGHARLRNAPNKLGC